MVGGSRSGEGQDLGVNVGVMICGEMSVVTRSGSRPKGQGQGEEG